MQDGVSQAEPLVAVPPMPPSLLSGPSPSRYSPLSSAS